MPNIIIPVGRPVVPEDDTCKTRMPVSAELAAQGDVTNHLAMWRFTRDGHHPVVHDESSTPVLEQNPSGVSHLVQHVWTSHPRVTYVRLVLGYQADEAPTGQDCTIEARLVDHATGNAVDPPGVAGAGVLWSKAARTLRTELRVRGRGFGVSINWPLLITDTGDATFAPAAYPTAPRPLNVGNAYRGNKLRLELTMTHVRLLWLVREEGFSAVVAQ